MQVLKRTHWCHVTVSTHQPSGHQHVHSTHDPQIWAWSYQKSGQMSSMYFFYTHHISLFFLALRSLANLASNNPAVMFLQTGCRGIEHSSRSCLAPFDPRLASTWDTAEPTRKAPPGLRGEGLSEGDQMWCGRKKSRWGQQWQIGTDDSIGMYEGWSKLLWKDGIAVFINICMYTLYTAEVNPFKSCSWTYTHTWRKVKQRLQVARMDNSEPSKGFIHFCSH